MNEEKRKQQLAEEYEQKKNQITQTLPTNPQCRFCGKEADFDVYCSKECEERDKELIEHRKKNHLCLNCGSANPTEGNDKDLCKDCLFQIWGLLDRINSLSAIIKNDRQ